MPQDPPASLLVRLGRIETVNQMVAAFADEENCRRILEDMVWPKGRFCPHCGSLRTTAIAGRDVGKKARPGLYQCSELACRRQFTATTKTPLHATKLPLRTWLAGFWEQLQSDKGISSVRLAEKIGVSQTTAWRMGHALRIMMANREHKLAGIVEADDVKIGGKPRKDPSNPAARKGKQGHTTKKPALVVVERPQGDVAGQVRAVSVPSLDKDVVAEAMRELIDAGAHLMTDGGGSFSGAADETETEDGETRPPIVVAHDTVTHSQQEYVRGIVHSNSAEGFNDRVRRTVVGVFHHISQKHVDSYLDETSFRWSQRVCIGLANRRTRKGRIVARKQWSRVLPAWQMMNLMEGAVGRQLRSTPDGGLRVLSRKGFVPQRAVAAQGESEIF